MKGLEDQLLGRVILTEKKELETERTRLISDVSANNRRIKELEANLLHKLTTVQVCIETIFHNDVFLHGNRSLILPPHRSCRVP